MKVKTCGIFSLYLIFLNLKEEILYLYGNCCLAYFTQLISAEKVRFLFTMSMVINLTTFYGSGTMEIIQNITVKGDLIADAEV